MKLDNTVAPKYYVEVVGFTGTQMGMSKRQKTRVRELLRSLSPSKIIHGDCIGADAQTHDMAEDLGIDIAIKPCTIRNKRAFKSANSVAKPEDPLERNKKIVEESDLVIACPKELKSTLRSGTWSTIRHAKKTEIPVWIIYPDGSEDPPVL